MKISATFAFGLFLALDILAMSLSCEDPRCREREPQQAQPAPPAQAFVPGEGQDCRDQIVSCFNTNNGKPTCPYPGQKIDASLKGSADGCSNVTVCVCRCPVAPIPKSDPQ